MGERIELQAADGHRLGAWLARPAGAPRGGLVVAMEIFGVNGHVRAVVDDFAAEGFLAIAPALFDRVERDVELGYDAAGIERGRALKARAGLTEAVLDAQAAMAAVAEAGRVGVVGYCWGGAVAFGAACARPAPACAVSYYGGGITAMTDARPGCPLLYHWGEQDTGIPVAEARAYADADTLGVHHFYPAGHGFNCDQRASFDAASAALARERTLAFLASHLGRS